MAEENGNKKGLTIVADKKNNENNSLNNSNIETGKKDIYNINIEDILENNDYFNDLINNSRSPYLNLITTNNIKKLLEFCLCSNIYEDNNKINKIRYPYYASQILCSQLVLLFSKSTKNIRKANSLLENKEKNNNYNENNESNDNNINYKSKSSDYGRSSGEYFDKALDINQNEDIFGEANRERNFAEFYQFKSDFGNEEKYAEISETEFYKEP